MEKQLRVWVLSGEEAKASFFKGNRDPRRLRALGFLAKIDFSTSSEFNAFRRGFALATDLEDPILCKLKEST